MIMATHWNGHQLCAIDVETTGLDPKLNEIIQICILPLQSNLEPRTDISPFYVDIAPQKSSEHWQKEALNTHGIDMVKLCATGLDPWTIADRFEHWFESLALPFKKKILPLAHNWPFEYKFLLEWLGEKTVNDLFWQYRDTMALANSVNDMADFANEPWPYPKTGLSYLCSQLKVENRRQHDALEDCIATAEVYKKLVTKHKYFS